MLRSWRRGGRSKASIKSARPKGANAQAFHKLSCKTAGAARALPSKMRKPVQALGLERSVRTLGKVRETKNSESATESRKRAKLDTTSVRGISPGRIGGVELALITVWRVLMLAGWQGIFAKEFPH